MTVNHLSDILQSLSWIDIVIISTNTLLAVFAQPILKHFLSGKISTKDFTLRFHLLRGLNVTVLVAYGYYLFYLEREIDGPAVTAITIIAVLYGTYIVNFFLQFLIQKHYGKARAIGERTLFIQTYQSRLFSILAVIILTLIASIAIIRLLGFESLLEAGGVLGIIGVLLALTQASWAPDIISGLIILNSDMFEEGDVIEFDNIIGRVNRTKLFHTELINLRNNHQIMLRNANIRDRTINNLSKFSTGVGLRECLIFNIDYGVSAVSVREVLTRGFVTAVENGCKAEGTPEPQICLLETGDHALSWGVYYHVKNIDHLISVRQQLRESILNAAVESNMSLATPLTHIIDR